MQPGREERRCRCGTGEPSPGADMMARGKRGPGADAAASCLCANWITPTISFDAARTGTSSIEPIGNDVCWSTFGLYAGCVCGLFTCMCSPETAHWPTRPHCRWNRRSAAYGRLSAIIIDTSSNGTCVRSIMYVTTIVPCSRAVGAAGKRVACGARRADTWRASERDAARRRARRGARSMPLQYPVSTP